MVDEYSDIEQLSMFRENHPKLEGFSRHYNTKILPELELSESKRLQAMAKVKKAGVLIAVLGVAVCISILFFRLNIKFLLIAGALFAVLGVGSSAYLLNAVKKETKGLLMGEICKFFGWEFTEEFERGSNLEQFLNLGLLPQHYNRASFEDRVSGQAHGAAFDCG